LEKSSFHFGTVGSPRSTPKKPGGSVGTVLHLASQELLAFELGWVRAVRVSEAKCAEIKSTAVETGVQLSVHAPYFINLYADAEEWPKSRRRLMDAAHFGNLAGASDIVFHPGSYFGDPPEEVLKVAIPRLLGCIEELRSAGNPVTLRAETMGKGAMLGSLKDTLIMAQEIEGVEPCLDFAHLHARTGDGSVNSYQEWVDIFSAYEKALGTNALKRLHCHLSGIEYSPKGERKHLMLSNSDFNLDDLLRALVEFKCGGRILCESPEDMDKDALLIKAAWEKASGM
jgi:deoxyribonuclease-4